MDLPIRIAAWRSAKRLTQRALAEAAGVTVSAVSLWESGDATPSQAHLAKVVETFGLTMQRFYGRMPRRRREAA